MTQNLPELSIHNLVEKLTYHLGKFIFITHYLYSSSDNFVQGAILQILVLQNQFFSFSFNIEVS